MKALLVAAAAVSVCLSLWAEDPVGSIDFADGPFTITRSGAAVAAPSIGDDVYDQDLIATGDGGSVTIALAAATGMTGTIKLSANSSLILQLDEVGGAQRTQAELISGQVGLKVKKIAGAPALTVSTDTASMGVRGTEFDVTTSDEGNLLVTCTEGEVACTDESGTTTAVPGQTVEKREGQRMQRRALALADYRSFREKWMADESTAFKRNARRAAGLLAVRYLDLLRTFQAIHEELSSSGILKQWMEDEKAGKSSASPDRAQQLAQVGPRLSEARKTLGAMMRISARIQALDNALKGDRVAMARRVRPDLTVSEFFERFRSQREMNVQREAWLLHAWKLYRRQLAAERAPSPAG